MFGMMSVFADFERAMISERVRAGIFLPEGRRSRSLPSNPPMVGPSFYQSNRRNDLGGTLGLHRGPRSMRRRGDRGLPLFIVYSVGKAILFDWIHVGGLCR